MVKQHHSRRPIRQDALPGLLAGARFDRITRAIEDSEKKLIPRLRRQRERAKAKVTRPRR
jgi:hypothetical protein